MDQGDLLTTIDRAAKEGWATLDLRYKGLTSLPVEIGHLSSLTELYLYRNHLSSLPAEIGQLGSLVGLDLGHNQLTSLPPEIGQLGSLVQLQLTRNQLTSLPAEIGQLRRLTRLGLGDNSLASLPAEIGQLSSLAELDVSDNVLTSLPAEIGQLRSLVMLVLYRNQLTSLPAEIGHLGSLTRLDVWGNRLTSLPAEIGQLRSLIRLHLAGNQLMSIPAEIGQLSSLTGLFLYQNRLTSLPAEVARLNTLSAFDAQGNPDLPIPPEILAKTAEPARIIDYYLTHQAAPGRPLNEAKVLLVGQGSVGKTSLVKRLVHGTFDENEGKTAGIDIQRWHVTVNGQQIRLNVWDFGGQEIMHATHQFFLTKRSLYVLVLDVRLEEQENRLEYWLKIIRTIGGDSPVIVVGNKCDQHPLHVNRRGLRKKYPQIKAFAETSCKTGDGIEDLYRYIAGEVGRLEHLSDPIPERWFAVKDRLDGMDRDYITYDQYVEICNEEAVTEDRSQRTLIGFLHDLGIVLHFTDPRLEPLGVLNPEWVTNGVYRILNSSLLFDARGQLDGDLLGQILDCAAYPPHSRMFIIDMMRKFELCFDFEGFVDQKFLVPDLLPKEELYTGKWNDHLGFQYHYDVLPGSVISRFIVRMHLYIKQNTCWRTGVLLAEEQNEALVRADLSDAKLFVRVRGPQSTRRPFLTVIRHTLDAIHETISQLQCAAKVPLPGHPDMLVDYRRLLDLERRGVEQDFANGPEGLIEYRVRDLLDGVVPEEERRRDSTFRKGDMVIMGDYYENRGQVGAMGRRAHAHDINFVQLWNQAGSDIDLKTLAGELSLLRQELKKEANTAEQDAAVGEVANAETAAKKSDGPKVLEHLKKAGEWALSVAENLAEKGIALAVSALRKALGA